MLVEGGERLVHEEHIGVHGEQAGDGHALLHAAGKQVRALARVLFEAHGLQCAHGALMRLARRELRLLERVEDVLLNGKPR